MSAAFLYGLVILSAIAHATWNAMMKSAGDRTLTMIAIRAVGLVIGLAALPFVDWPAAAGWKWLAATSLVQFSYYALLIRSYDIGDMSVVYPLSRGVAPVLTTIAAFLFAGEVLGPAICWPWRRFRSASWCCRCARVRAGKRWDLRSLQAPRSQPIVSWAVWACARPAPCWAFRPASRS